MVFLLEEETIVENVKRVGAPVIAAAAIAAE